MTGVPICTITITQRKKVWIFPKHRFVEFGPEDESYCRAAGYGGEEEQEVKTVMPNMYLAGMMDDGRLTFRSAGTAFDDLYYVGELVGGKG